MTKLDWIEPVIFCRLALGPWKGCGEEILHGHIRISESIRN